MALWPDDSGAGGKRFIKRRPEGPKDMTIDLDHGERAALAFLSPSPGR
jgi:hypothetical protein